MGNPYDTYLETRVLGAEPLELLDLMYGAALAAVRNARASLARGDIAMRSREITKAESILLELVASLERDRAPDIAGRLNELYAYMGRRLNDANTQQRDEPLAEVQTLLTTLQDAWRECFARDREGEDVPAALVG